MRMDHVVKLDELKRETERNSQLKRKTMVGLFKQLWTVEKCRYNCRSGGCRKIYYYLSKAETFDHSTTQQVDWTLV